MAHAILHIAMVCLPLSFVSYVLRSSANTPGWLWHGYMKINLMIYLSTNYKLLVTNSIYKLLRLI